MWSVIIEEAAIIKHEHPFVPFTSKCYKKQNRMFEAGTRKEMREELREELMEVFKEEKPRKILR